jgi:signal transduction histidine kinase/CheY-like chemotaxis protein
MLKSRLYWKVIAHFGILIGIITAMAVLTGSVLRDIEKNFQYASDDTRFLGTIERVQYDLAELSTHADEYAHTGNFSKRLDYERELRNIKSHIAELSEISGDSLSLSLLKEAESHLSYWISESGNRRLEVGDLITGHEPELLYGGVSTLQRYNDHHLEFARNILRELYRNRIDSHQTNIDRATHVSQNITTFIYIVNILLAIFAVILGIVLTRSIVQPLRNLREGTERLTDGTFEPLIVDRNDELGDLAENFNTMSVLLYAQYQKLKTYSDLVTHLNASSNLRSVAGRSLSHLSLYTGAFAGALYLLNRHTKMLDRINCIGFESDGSISHSVAYGEGYIGECAKTGRRSVHAFNRGSELSLPGFPPDERGYMTVIPVEFRERIIGVLLLTSHADFRNEQVHIINQSMPQIAISITNARHYEETQNLSLEIAHKNKELHRKNIELEKVYRVKSDFLSSISHELRTPLNSVIGYSSVLLNPDAEPLTKDQRKSLEKVLKSGKHLLQLINDILDISKIEAGRMSLSVESDNVQNIVSQSILTIEPLLISKKLQLKKSMQRDLPPMNTDILKIRQILINLLNNAVKFTERGTIHLRVYHRDRMIHFEVRDPGIGIAEEDHEVIFEEFKQVDSSNARKHHGTGLGLPIARRLARLLGGDLTVKSRLGKGSIFTLSVPPELIPTGGNNSKPDARIDSNIHPNPSISIKPFSAVDTKMTILCIDDDPDAIEILKNYLIPEGYSVTSALSGNEGIELAHKLKPALITLDILMPEKDGWQVLRELKQSPDTGNIPVIIHSIVDNQPLALSLGAIDIMPKPVDANKLLSLVRLSCAANDRYVLLIDDNREFTQVMSELIEHGGYRIRTADNVVRASEMLREAKPAIIFLDLVMPEMDGFGFITELKSDESYRDIPVIILSGKTLTGPEMDFIESHVEHYMRKEEFSHEAILNTIKRILTPSRMVETEHETQR